MESFVDEIAALARVDPVEFRLRRLTNPRGVEALKRTAASLGGQPRPSPRPVDSSAAVLTGRGIAYVHYKHDETLVAMGMEVAVERTTGRIRVTRVVCAQDCGLMINPECVQSQLEGNIIQTLSRALHEEVVYDRDRVTTVDWATYPILTFPEVPALEFELIQRLDQPPLGAGEAASTPVAAALATPCSTRRACDCGRYRSAPSGQRPRWPDADGISVCGVGRPRCNSPRAGTMRARLHWRKSPSLSTAGKGALPCNWA